MDTAFRSRVEVALLAAIAEVFGDGSRHDPAAHTDAVVDALLVTVAGVLGNSPRDTGSPARLRNTLDHVVKRVGSRIAAVRAGNAATHRRNRTRNLERKHSVRR